jgi:hypothetical protein
MIAGIDEDAQNSGANIFGIGYYGDLIDNDGQNHATFVVTGSQVVINNATSASSGAALTVGGNIHVQSGSQLIDGRTIIKIFPPMFHHNDDVIGGDTFIEDDTTNKGIKVTNANLELFAWVDVPLGYTATKVKINGKATDNAVEVYTLDLDGGTIGSEISNTGLTVNDDTDLDTNHVGAENNALYIKVYQDTTGDVIFGGYVYIQPT